MEEKNLTQKVAEFGQNATDRLQKRFKKNIILDIAMLVGMGVTGVVTTVMFSKQWKSDKAHVDAVSQLANVLEHSEIGKRKD